MNCKPGDLARIVMPYLEREKIGLPVSVLRAGLPRETVWSRDGEHCVNEGSGAQGWLCDAHGDGFPCFIGDDFLRPIRDPGDDAVDESKGWLPPVPLPTIEPYLLDPEAPAVPAQEWIESFARATGYNAKGDPLNLLGHLPARARAFYPGETIYPGKMERL